MTAKGRQVTVLKRHLILTLDEMLLDLEPFFSPPSIIETHTAVGTLNHTIGQLTDLKVIGPRTYDISYRGVGISSNITHTFEIAAGALTIWRIDGGLDALQACLGTDRTWVYFQTGGAGLLDIWNAVENDEVARELAAFFSNQREP